MANTLVVNTERNIFTCADEVSFYYFTSMTLGHTVKTCQTNYRHAWHDIKSLKSCRQVQQFNLEVYMMYIFSPKNQSPSHQQWKE